MGALVALGFGGCGGGASVVRPGGIGAGEAIGEAFQCTPEKLKGDLTPFTVDWNDGERTALESAMRKGVAVVSLTCDGPKVLRACQVVGDYRYNGMNHKTKLVQMNDLATVATNFGGVLTTAAFRADLSQGRTLNLAYTLVGDQATAVSDVQAAQLVGRCEGATHFVFEAQLGAFVLETSESGRADVSAETLFGSGAAQAASSKRVRTTDGDPATCAGASRKDVEPVDGCSALMRVELMAIRGGGAKAEVVERGGATKAAIGCPAGYDFVDGACQAPAPAAPKLCSYTEPAACLTECQKGSVASCDRWGFTQLQAWDTLQRTWYVFVEERSNSMEALDKFQQKDTWRPLFLAWAENVLTQESLLQAACDQDQKAACGALGVAIYTRAWSPEASDEDFNRWKDAALRGCALGDTFSCMALYNSGMTVTRDDRTASNISNEERWLAAMASCSKGNGDACAVVVADEGWQLFRNDAEVTRYTQQRISKVDLALEFRGTLDRACTGGFRDACVIAAALRVGDATQCSTMRVDTSPRPKGFGYDKRSAELPPPEEMCCVFSDLKVPTDTPGAIAILKSGCSAGHALSCERLDQYFPGNR